MFRDTIKGLDKVFGTDVTPPKVVLVTGPPGSLKSGFVTAILSLYLEHTNEFGLYATLEETTESHIQNMESLGTPLCLNLQISDYTDLRQEGDETLDYFKFTQKMIEHFKKMHGDRFTCFAFDSLGALYSLMDTPRGQMRKKMYHFFKFLRDQRLISLIIMERVAGGESDLMGNEGFLSDGIIYLGLRRKQGKLVRYLQVEKMRATRHSMEQHALEIGSNGIAVLGPIFEE